MSVQGTKVSVTVLSATEFRDYLCARYNVSPLNFQRHCDGYSTVFVVMNTLRCSIDGLVITHHNEICDKIIYLSQRAFN